MQTVSSIEELRPWCLAAEVNDTATFAVNGKVTQDDASAFARSVNSKRVGHVWVEVKDLTRTPDPVTHIDVRCSH
jgi:hypothetical protein